MTTPVTPRIPTPGDLARRPAPKPGPPARTAPAPSAPHAKAAPEQTAESRPRAADAIAPGKLKSDEHFRKHYLFGLRFSGMHPHARLVGHDLMWRAVHATGRVSPKLQPSVEAISMATGLTTAQVDVALQVLRTRGWLYDRLVTEGPRSGGTAFELAIPAWALEKVRAHLKRKPSDRGV
ncbi:hypothetical protein JL475_24485 [Streptomyces sp. M2CJ-2]|uniref:hypothetical protein n=1 Tax=Streptomyces sp. M2CJ-2 TaxID=2803948 RepID=UPI0019291638|nr:hypothetical protein [Streptomyces sp. M2CJ-2]MBL3669094.1 hypothetical protein [Streptomyces sp. M2CJ-2]